MLVYQRVLPNIYRLKDPTVGKYSNTMKHMNGSGRSKSRTHTRTHKQGPAGDHARLWNIEMYGHTIHSCKVLYLYIFVINMNVL